MVQFLSFLTENVNLFSDKQNSRLKVSYHRIINYDMAKRLEDFTFEDLLSVFKCDNIGLKHCSALRLDKIVAVNG